MWKDHVQNLHSVIDILNGVNLVSVPNQIHVIARHQELVFVLRLQVQVQLVPLQTLPQKLLVLVMRQGDLVEEQLLPLSSFSNVIAQLCLKIFRHLGQVHWHLIQGQVKRFFTILAAPEDLGFLSDLVHIRDGMQVMAKYASIFGLAVFGVMSGTEHVDMPDPVDIQGRKEFFIILGRL